MTSTFFKDLYEQAESGEGVASASIPEGEYDVRVKDARAYAPGGVIFLDLEVTTGPLAGKISEVSIRFPQEGDKPFARNYFAAKINGLIAQPQVKAAFVAADSAPSPEAGYETIAASLKGALLTAKIGFGKGNYANQNELKSTTVTVGAPAAPAPAAAPAAAAPAPAAVAPAPVPVADPPAAVPSTETVAPATTVPDSNGTAAPAAGNWPF